MSAWPACEKNRVPVLTATAMAETQVSADSAKLPEDDVAGRKVSERFKIQELFLLVRASCITYSLLI